MNAQAKSYEFPSESFSVELSQDWSQTNDIGPVIYGWEKGDLHLEVYKELARSRPNLREYMQTTDERNAESCDGKPAMKTLSERWFRFRGIAAVTRHEMSCGLNKDFLTTTLVKGRHFMEITTSNDSEPDNGKQQKFIDEDGEVLTTFTIHAEPTIFLMEKDKREHDSIIRSIVFNDRMPRNPDNVHRMRK